MDTGEEFLLSRDDLLWATVIKVAERFVVHHPRRDVPPSKDLSEDDALLQSDIVNLLGATTTMISILRVLLFALFFFFFGCFVTLTHPHGGSLVCITRCVHTKTISTENGVVLAPRFFFLFLHWRIFYFDLLLRCSTCLSTSEESMPEHSLTGFHVSSSLHVYSKAEVKLSRCGVCRKMNRGKWTVDKMSSRGGCMDSFNN